MRLSEGISGGIGEITYNGISVEISENKTLEEFVKETLNTFLKESLENFPESYLHVPLNQPGYF